VTLAEDERVAWAVLALADTFEQMWNGREETSNLKVAMAAVRAARHRLRDRFGLNLDDIFCEARDAYFELVDAEKAKLEAEKDKQSEMEARHEKLRNEMIVEEVTGSLRDRATELRNAAAAMPGTEGAKERLKAAEELGRAANEIERRYKETP